MPFGSSSTVRGRQSALRGITLCADARRHLRNSIRHNDLHQGRNIQAPRGRVRDADWPLYAADSPPGQKVRSLVGELWPEAQQRHISIGKDCGTTKISPISCAPLVARKGRAIQAVVESAMKGSKQTPWWESQLPILSREFYNYVRKRLPTLVAEHDDLVNEALSDLSVQIGRHSGAFPATWLQSEAPGETDRARLKRLGLTILRRRIADMFRNQAKEWSQSRDIENYPDFRDFRIAPAEKGVMLAKALRVTLDVLARWPLNDRNLFGLLPEAESHPGAFTPRERHRIRKLREKLRSEIVRQVGSSVKELLRDES